MLAKNKRYLELMYRFRWLLGILSVLLCIGLFMAGGKRLGEFSEKVDSLKEIPPKKKEPKMVDARLDIWFDQADPGVRTLYQIEDEFIPEDTVLVAFEEKNDPWGVFGERSLETVARLTKSIGEVPYVRHVRSVTQTPWIRWGDAGGGEQGLLVTDLFDAEPSTFTREQRLERMIAILGARRAAALAGEKEVRALLGPDANFDDYIGEPRLVNGIVSPDGRTTALMVQLLRDKVPAETLHKTFGDDEKAQEVASSVHSTETQWQALDRIQEILAKEKGYDFHLTGMPQWERNYPLVVQRDMKWIGVMFLVIAIVLAVLFRRIGPTVLPMIVMLIAVFGMVGALFASGNLMTSVSQTAIMVVLAVGIAESIHIVNSFYDLRPQYTNKKDLYAALVEHNARPIILTSLTTAVGFFSLGSGSLQPIAQFGLFGGIGTLLACLLAITLVPAAFSLLPVPPKKKSKRSQAREAREKQASTDLYDLSKPYWTDRFVMFGIRNRKGILVVCALAVAFTVYGASRVDTSSDFRTWFPRDPTGIVGDTNWIDAKIGGSGDLELLFTAPAIKEDPQTTMGRQARLQELEAKKLGGTALSGGEETELKKLADEEARYQRRRIAVSAEFLGEIDRFERRLRQEMADRKSPLHILTKVESGLDIVRKIHQVQNENKAAFYRLPTMADIPQEARQPRLVKDDVTGEADYIPAQDVSSMVAQYYMQYESGAKPVENLSSLISPDRRSFRIVGRVLQDTSSRHKAAYARVRQILEKEFPKLTGSVGAIEKGDALSGFTMTGRTYLFANMIDVLGINVMIGMAITIAVVILMFVIIFRSFTMGVVAVVPNVLPIVVPLAAFGVLGILLDAPAAVISTVVLGVTVDETMFVITKFRQAQKEGKRTEEALKLAFREIGKAITYSAIILIAGFAVFGLSDFYPNIVLGKLATMMLALAWVCELVISPAMLSFVRDKK